jgi:hypothetical protein
MADVKFNCATCNQSLEAPQEMLGKTINCPSCQSPIAIPTPPPQRPTDPRSSNAPKWAPRTQGELSKPFISIREEPRIAKAFADLSSILVAGEKLEASAIQRRLFALTKRRSISFATSGRLIGMSRGLLGGFTPHDVRWQDVKNARIRVGIFGAELTIEALTAPDLAMAGESTTIRCSGLRKDEAQAVYRICQKQEQVWREKRRFRELEELRAKSGGIQLGAPAVLPLSPQPATETDDAIVRLQRAKDMLEKGLINDSEFETIKARIVGNM